MEWYEILIVLAAVGIVVAVVARAIYKKVTGKGGGCDCGCGCTNCGACSKCSRQNTKDKNS